MSPITLEDPPQSENASAETPETASPRLRSERRASS